MDNPGFDALTRRIETTLRFRRRLVQLLAGGGVGLLFGHGPRVVDATRHRHHADHGGRHQPPSEIAAVTCRAAQTKESGLDGKACARKGPLSKRPCCPGSSCLRKLSNGTFRPTTGQKKGRCYCDDGYANLGGSTSCTKLPPPDQCIALQGVCNVGKDICCDIGGSAVDCQSIDATKGRGQCDTAGGHTRCCLTEGAACSADCDCCRALRCQNGACAPPPEVCHPLSESCADGEPCCAGAGACINGRCCQGDGVPCGFLCSAESDCTACCAGYCRGDGRCGPPQGCIEYGGFCTTSAECCNNVDCTSGRCRFP